MCDINTQVVGGRLNLKLGIDEVYTLTTLARDPPKLYPVPPPSQPFPLPYYDDFEGRNTVKHLKRGHVSGYKCV